VVTRQPNFSYIFLAASFEFRTSVCLYKHLDPMPPESCQKESCGDAFSPEMPADSDIVKLKFIGDDPERDESCNYQTDSLLPRRQDCGEKTTVIPA